MTSTSRALSLLLSLSLLAGCGGQVTVVEARVTCPDGTRPGADGACGQAVQLEPAKPPEPELFPDSPAQPPAPSPRANVAIAAGTDVAEALRFLRDPRGGRPARARALLVTEIQGFEVMYTNAGAAAPPGLLRKLGDDYAELEAAAERDHSHKVANAARLAAIRYYHQLSTTYPKFCAAPGASCGDEILYALGWEYERADQLDGARKTYLALIQNYPQSRLVPHTYLAFGEMFFNEAAADPAKWVFAEQSYLEVMKYPYPGNDVHGYAILRLGMVYERKGDGAKASHTYRKLHILARQHPGSDAIQLPVRFIPDGA